MKIHNEFSGTITLTENSSRELFKVLQEQDKAFINDMLDGRCGFTLKSADGRSVELVPKADRPQGEWKSVKASIYPYGYDVECSICGHRMGSSFGYKFCPNCGARMKGADNE